MHRGALFTGQSRLGGEHELRDRGQKLRARSRAAPNSEVDDPLLQPEQLTGRIATSDCADPPAGTQLDVFAAVRVDAEVDRLRIVEQPRRHPLDLLDRRAVGGPLGEIAQRVETSERRLLVRQSLRVQSDRDLVVEHERPPGKVEQSVERRPVEADRLGLALPPLAQGRV